MQEFLSSKFGYRMGQVIIALIVIVFFVCSFLFSGCNTAKYGIRFNPHTGEAVYYGLPPLDTLRNHIKKPDLDMCEVKGIFLWIDDNWLEVPAFSQLRPVPISIDSRQESIYLQLYRFGEYGDREGIYSAMMPYSRSIP